MKSHVSDCLKMMEAIYLDACHQCCTEVSFRDLDTIRSRVRGQGISFLTITLPNFCRDFEKSLDQGFIDSNCFRFFRKQRSIPAFLQGLISQVFDQETGRINDDPFYITPIYPQTVVASIRQVCLAFKKIELACTPARTHKALGGFIEIERSFSQFQVSEDAIKKFSLVSSVLWDNLLHDLRVSDLVPRHGPGATADHISGNSKYVWRVWHNRLEPFFPLVDSAYPLSIAGQYDSSEELQSVVCSDEEQPVRVTPVPKTLKGPRIIAIEPCCMQFAQQGIRRVLYDKIESYWLTRGHINFRDQSFNQSRAMSSSVDNQLATIDLSDASDRVPHDLARIMFQSNPDLLDSIEACRSTHAKLPDGTVIGPLRKFASMGSALCFPIEAMYFYTICVMALLSDNGLPVSQKSATLVSSDIHVYGDDLIVPVHNVHAVFDHLNLYNCKVNTNKTFYRGSFRESCGVDAFLGTDVTPVYIGAIRPVDRKQSHDIISLIENARAFSSRGYTRISELMFSWAEEVIGPLPLTRDDSPVIGRNLISNYFPPKRWNSFYQRFEVKCWTSEPVYRTDPLDGYAALMKSLSLLSTKPVVSRDWWIIPISDDDFSSFDPLHLERSSLHGAVSLKRRWVPLT